ncbi:uncharacterized protein LOC125024530 [Penaeus chinensis]|uniref:uncharacterized protein LOC125024530 n=1 Tax=Penaeus chinensis TaxID=139456 RepID=UPI001FB844C8|nr:uncharacterized protein LOC125024530 [Penaeus chinensis]
MYPSMAYGGCQHGDLDQLCKSVCQGFDLSLFGEEAEASCQPSYEESVSFAGFQAFQEQDSLTSGDISSYSNFGEAAWHSHDLPLDRAYPEEFSGGWSPDAHPFGHPNYHQEFTPINEMGSEGGSPSPSGNSTSPTLHLDSRTLKMHEWSPQTDPELERKRVRALKAFAIRQKNKSQEAQCQSRLEQVRGEIARLKSTKTRQKKRLDILNAIWQQYR